MSSPIEPSSSSSPQDDAHHPRPLRSLTSKTSSYFPVLRRIQSRRRDRDHPPPQDSLRLPRNRRSLSQPPPVPALAPSSFRTSPPPPIPPATATATVSPVSALATSHNNATVADLALMQLPSPRQILTTLSQQALSPPSVSPASVDSPASQRTLFSLRLVPHLDSSRSLHFEPIERKIPPSSSLKIGRFTDRGVPPGSNASNHSARIAFKSKVVSRGHADIFTDPSGSFFIKDTKSSSGTFLNHVRLSAPGGESRPFPLRDGDVLQLGVDYQGGTEEIYRCVRMRIELNRAWQRSPNVFNQQALSQLRSLGVQGTTSNKTQSRHPRGHSSASSPNSKTADPPEPPKAVSDCCICLFGVTVCQALFIAPCSHTYHYKCIRPLLQMHHPGFSCPLCRAFADLEADVETEDIPPKSPVTDQSGHLSSAAHSEILRSVPAALSGSTPAPPLPGVAQAFDQSCPGARQSKRGDTLPLTVVQDQDRPRAAQRSNSLAERIADEVTGGEGWVADSTMAEDAAASFLLGSMMASATERMTSLVGGQGRLQGAPPDNMLEAGTGERVEQLRRRDNARMDEVLAPAASSCSTQEPEHESHLAHRLHRNNSSRMTKPVTADGSG